MPMQFCNASRPSKSVESKRDRPTQKIGVVHQKIRRVICRDGCFHVLRPPENPKPRKNGPTTPKAWHSGPIAWHSGPIAWHSGPKRGTAARSKQDIQDIQILRGAARAWCAVWPCHRPPPSATPSGGNGPAGRGVGAASRPKPLRKRFPALLAHPPRATLPDPASARLRPSGALCGASDSPPCA